MAGDEQLRDLRDGSDGSGESRPTVGYRRRRSLRLRLPWWVDVGFGRLSTGVVVVLVLIGVTTAGLFGGRLILGSGSGDTDDRVLASDKGVAYGEDLDPRFGQEIAPLERLRWQRFGRLLHIGPNGIPLVEMEETGEVRELTDLEMNFPHDRDYLRDPLDRSVVFAPGPSGNAVRWWKPVMYEELPDARAFDRIGWFVEHEERLEAVVADLSLALNKVSTTRPDAWDRRWGQELMEISDALVDEYAYGKEELWVLVGALSYCRDDLEMIYRQGITEGCPSDGYQETVSMIWRDIGQAVSVMRRIGGAATLQGHPTYGHLFRDASVGEYQSKQVDMLGGILDDIRGHFERLREYGHAEGYYIDVVLP